MIPAEAAFEHWMSDEDLEQEITEHYLSTAKIYSHNQRAQSIGSTLFSYGHASNGLCYTTAR
ncbi:hypothetical protein IFM47457_05608 [Aspergillus lentulus]|nr:hypothetical protein IFM47457_05608 [Aspergillus lentulus]